MKVEIYGKVRREKPKEEQRKEKNLWTEEGKRYYQEEIEKIQVEKEEPNELMEELTTEIKGATCKKVIRMESRKIGWKKWWNKECTERKREANKSTEKVETRKGRIKKHIT